MLIIVVSLISLIFIVLFFETLILLFIISLKNFSMLIIVVSMISLNCMVIFLKH